jgi:hypothetical protein
MEINFTLDVKTQDIQEQLEHVEKEDTPLYNKWFEVLSSSWALGVLVIGSFDKFLEKSCQTVTIIRLSIDKKIRMNKVMQTQFFFKGKSKWFFIWILERQTW